MMKNILVNIELSISKLSNVFAVGIKKLFSFCFRNSKTIICIECIRFPSLQRVNGAEGRQRGDVEEPLYWTALCKVEQSRLQIK